MSCQLLNVGSSKQLFIDDRFIESSHHVTLAVNPPQKCEVVLRGEEPWEVAGAFSTIVDDEGKVKLYYNTHTHGDKYRRCDLCYAESNDGIHFTKPRFGLIERAGTTANNVIFPNVIDACPFIDPIAPPEQRWKLLYCYGRDGKIQATEPEVRGIYIATSADGIRWTPHPTRLFPWISETQKIARWDGELEKYVVYLRVTDSPRPGSWRRAIGRIEVDDIMRPWPAPAGYEEQHHTPPGAATRVLCPDDDDPPETDLYISAYVKYPFAADAHFMFPTAYRHTPHPVGVDHNDGLLASQFACSRDGIRWMRPDRRPYVRPGLSTELDRFYTMMVAGMVRRGEYIYQYYVAKGSTHHGPTADLSEEVRRELGKNCIVRLKQRLDGFMSADAAYTGGTLTTPPLTFTGTRLELNIDTESTGTATIELLDHRGAPISGFTNADCDVVAGNYTARIVTWRGSANLAALAGRPIRLRLAMRSTKLYAFQFV